MKKILLVGDGNHQFIRYLAKWLKKNAIDTLIIDVLTITEVKEESFYDNIYNIRQNVLISKMPKIRSWWLRKQFTTTFKNLKNKYDIINFHYITPLFFDIYKFDCEKDILLSFWGSDFHKANEKSRQTIRKFIEFANVTTVTNPEMMKELKTYYTDLNAKIEVVPFGLEPLEHLKNINISKKDSKRTLNIPIDKIAVCIGYNRSPHQHHIAILDSIKLMLSNIEKENIILLLPLTYGSDMKYLNELKAYLKHFDIKYKTFFDFLTNNEVANLRKATDIFIQLQTTDQFSGSMQEHMYAKNLVITGSWLPYKILEENYVYFRKINKIEEIGKELQYCLRNFTEESQKVLNNNKVIYTLSGWPSIIGRWYSVYNLK